MDLCRSRLPHKNVNWTFSLPESAVPSVPPENPPHTTPPPLHPTHITIPDPTQVKLQALKTYLKDTLNSLKTCTSSTCSVYNVTRLKEALQVGLGNE